VITTVLQSNTLRNANRRKVEAKRRRVEIENASSPPVTRGRNPVLHPGKRSSDDQASLECFLGESTQRTLDVPTRKQPSRRHQPLAVIRSGAGKSSDVLLESATRSTNRQCSFLKESKSSKEVSTLHSQVAIPSWTRDTHTARILR
jgi:hypothetical protein